MEGGGLQLMLLYMEEVLSILVSRLIVAIYRKEG